LVSIAMLLCSTRAEAAPNTTRVVLLRPPRADAVVREAVTRARAELEAEGFEVLVQSSTATDQRRSLMRAADDNQAAAAIWVFPIGGRPAADVWVTDRVTNKTVIRTIDVRDVEPSGRAAAIAIRTVELLRASLVETLVRDEPVPAAVKRFVSGANGPLAGVAAELGVGVLASVDELGVAGAPLARLSFGLDMGLGMRLSWLGPAFGASAAGAVGTAEIRQEMLTFELFYAPEVNWSGLSPMIWLGGGFYHLVANGELQTPYTNQSAEVWSAAGVLGVGLGYRLTDEVMALLDAEAVLTAPRAVVTMLGERVGTAGRPSIGSTLGIVMRF
jgi:hypothetical protein